MITYGLRMQERRDEVPKEVATWLIERNLRYPKINFTVDCHEPHSSQIEEFVFVARRYSRLYVFWRGFVSTRVSGVNIVVFPYLSEQWTVKIVGGINKKGEIADLTIDESRRSLPPSVRAEIAGLPVVANLPSDMEKVSEDCVGVLRKKDDPPLDRPTEMIPLLADGRYTSKLSLSGEELDYLTKFAPLIKNPATREEATTLFYKKDWEALKRLAEQNRE